VKAYQDCGFEVQVFYNHEPAYDPFSYHFDGVDVRVGDELELRRFLSQHNYDAFLIHFPEPSRVEPVLSAAREELPVLIWIHGFEAEAWFRRWFNFTTTQSAMRAALEKRDSYHKLQNEFLGRLIRENRKNLTFVNVSKWFQEMVVEPDLHAEIRQGEVIPNFVDEKLFTYKNKNPQDRKKILSLRPFASNKYANDLTVAAIWELSKRPFFSDLEFSIIGKGKLFENVTRPITGFSNVHLEERFISQKEIPSLHANYGIFLCPTRFDSQGVSMCEAMSSGLVPISTRTAAIPEFVEDGVTGLLADPEDPKSIADKIEELYFDESEFLNLSRKASRSIHVKCGFNATIGKEIELIERSLLSSGK